MPDLAYPSEDAPSYPRVVLTLPQGWSPAPAREHLLRALGPERAATDPSLRPQVSVDILTCAPGEGYDLALAHAVSDLEGVAGLEVDPPFEVEISGQRFTGVNHSWLVEQAPYVRVVLVGVADRGAVEQVVRLSGSVGGSHVDEDYGSLQEMFEGAVIEGVVIEAGAN